MFATLMRGLLVLAISSSALLSCQKSDKADQNRNPPTAGSNGMSPRHPKAEQVPPPFDLKTPPADAIKTADGLVYKKEVTNDAGDSPKRNDTVTINYTGWHQNTGETFFTNKSRGAPMPLNLSTTAPGFTEAMQLLKKGEKAMLWVPPSIGYKGTPAGTPETLVYEVELVDIVPAPPVPADLAAPPANAQTTPKGTKYEILKPATGTTKAKSYDTLTYNYTAWDSTGRMYETTEMKKKPAKLQPYKQSATMEDMLTQLTAGERVRFWSTADKMAMSGRPLPGMPTGPVVYEIELITIEPGVEPPPVPPDVAKPPADAKKTDKGVFYKVLKAGPAGGAHPKPTETVKVNYTGWTTDGRMFDSSVIRKEPAEFSLQGVIAGWTDGIPQMILGDKFRFWIPEELAYKGQPGRPQGMLVFDVELLEIKAPPPKPAPGPHGPHPSMPNGHPPMPPGATGGTGMPAPTPHP
jgi:FKBP-type peptidyl-prolyl cis-trans isomerase